MGLMNMPGLTKAGLRAHYALVPLFASLVAGGALSSWYLARLALHTSDVVINKWKHPYPWNEVKHNERTKFFQADHLDYKELKKPAGRPELPPMER